MSSAPARPLQAVLEDSRWSTRAPHPLLLGAATFSILALELALIRWTSGQVRILAYFSNLVLMVAFLGMGVGVALGKRMPGLVHLALPLLLLVSIPLALAEPLDLVHMRFPDAGVFLWGGEDGAMGPAEALKTLGVFSALLMMILGVFVCAGAPVGFLFAGIPAQRAYAFDLAGSLLGIAAFTSATALDATPPVWLLIGALPLAVVSRKAVGAACLVGVVALGQFSIRDALFSPYNRIDLKEHEVGLVLSVNRDFHQAMHDLSDGRVNSAANASLASSLRHLRRSYDLPFVLASGRGRALVVGAGTGNDVQAALRHGFQSVDSVDIDPRIMELGKRLHPEHPYADPRVTPVVNDARAYFEQYQGAPYDVVAYGLLDSHAMFSAMSSLRLDNYVYTEEGIRAAWGHVAPGGLLALSFSVAAGDWLRNRLFWTVARATGRTPVVINHGMHHGATFLVSRGEVPLDLTRLESVELAQPTQPEEEVHTTSDDWPFLYVRTDVFPWAYALVLLGLLLLAALLTPWAFGREAMTRQFDPALFFMGAAFLLLETRSVTSLALLLGSTWLVNSAVFGAILLLALVANLLATHFKLTNPIPWFVLLVATATALWAFDVAWLNRFPLLTRATLGALANALPIGCAGVVVSILLARSPNASAALGSNLLGSVLGGCLEYLSMFIGLRALVLMALCLYLAALGSILGRTRSPPSS